MRKDIFIRKALFVVQYRREAARTDDFS